jgi:Fe-S-cluster containining protein
VTVHSLEADLERARDLDIADLADAIETIGFECTRCGACCKAVETDDGEEEHTATVFPGEVRRLQETGAGKGEGDNEVGATASEYDWRDVARPMPYGLREGEDGPEGETFEWALQTNGCGDCVFYEEDGNTGTCSVHSDRPLICRTYPFSVALGGTAQPMGETVDRHGVVRAHECEGLGRDIAREEAEELATALKERAVRELEEAISVRDTYAPATPAPGEVVVHDSEGKKRLDGTPYSE